MQILTKWGYRMQRDNLMRSVTTILAVAGTYMLLSGSAFILEAMIRAAGTQGGIHSWGMLSVITNNAFGQTCVISLVMLCSLFTVTVRECKPEIRLLSTAGATSVQLWKSLMLRTLVLDVAGAGIGIPAGLLMAFMVLPRQEFRQELPFFFTEERTVITLLTEFAVVLFSMVVASLGILVPRVRRFVRLRAPKHGMFRRSLTRSVFGVGGVLGKLNTKKTRRFQAAFTFALALNVAVTALLGVLCDAYVKAEPMDYGYNMTIECVSHPDRAQMIEGRINAALESCSADGLTAYSATYHMYEPYYAYMVVSDGWVSPALHRAENRRRWTEETQMTDVCYAIRQSGAKQQMVNMYGCVFMPDDAFEKLAAENGVARTGDGALLCNTVEYRMQMLPLLTAAHPDTDVTMHFLPSTFIYHEKGKTDADAGVTELGEDFPLAGLLGKEEDAASNRDAFDADDFVRQARNASTTVTFRIAGLLSQDPFGNAYGYPILYFPERMYDAFRALEEDPLYLAGGASYAEYLELNALKNYFISTTDHAAVRARLLEAIGKEPDCAFFEPYAAVGYKEYSPDVPAYVTDSSSGAAGYVLLTDYTMLSEGHETLRSTSLPKLYAAFFLMTVMTLIAGILNAVHMNRMLRRREFAMLESIGMEQRQKMGMMLYESARYSVYSMLFGVGIFWVAYQILYRRLIPFLSTDGLHPANAPYLNSLTDTFMFTYTFRQSFRALLSAWWIFLLAGVTIFVMLLASAVWIDRRTRKEDLIRILKEDN